jgi:DNA-binding HxlR family transcriptional regulator
MPTSQLEKKYCPIIKPSKLLGDSWVLLIVKELLGGPKRFNQLGTAIPEITNRVLTQRLKFLCENGIIERTEYKTKTPKVEYHLTPMGTALKPILKSIEDFGNKFMC